MPYGTVNADLMTTSDGVSSSGLYGFKNRIINGAMVIDQRNAGASITPTTSGDWWGCDRWRYNVDQSSKFSTQQSSVAPAGFTNSTLITSLSAYSVISSDVFTVGQVIEGFNVSDLGWGAAGAQAVTLSFWVRSSLTGTFGGAINNSGFTRSYPFTFTINAANTYEYKTITIAGDTTGTWLTTNGAGIRVYFSLGMGSTRSGTAGAWAAGDFRSATGATSVVGTNGATFYITGVQLEKGSTATSFDYRPYGTELALCQRYLPAFVATGINQTLPFVGCGVNSTTQAGTYTFEVATRTPPTGITVSSASHFTSSRPSTGVTVSTAINFAASSNYACQIEIKAASGLTADVPYLLYSNSASGVMLFTGCEL